MRWPAIAAIVVLAAPLAGAAADDEPGVIRVEMLVGQVATVSGGPIRELICDDGALVRPEYVENGVALKGLRAGNTLCSFRDAASVRRVLRVVVREPPASDGASSPAKGGG